MSKHNILTEDEFSIYVPNQRIVTYLDNFCNHLGLMPSEVSILDWGCGRGKDVLYLRQQGYNAFGVDIDPEPIRNGICLFHQKGFAHSTLSLIDRNAKTRFSDTFFHFIFSNQVFEHIDNLGLVAKEFQRITKRGGIGFHVYPAHRYVVEGHLFMPFVHWLPKNKLRKYLIICYLLLGRDPRWSECVNLDIIRKGNIYFNYSINKTFYRPYKKVEKIFKKNGFIVNFETINHPKLRNYTLLYNLAKFKFTRALISHLFLTFKSVELVIKKV